MEGSVDVAEDFEGLISGICSNDDWIANTGTCGAARVIPSALFTALRAHGPVSVTVAEKGATTLGWLVIINRFHVDAVASYGVLDVARCVMPAHVQDVAVQKQWCWALLSLIGSASPDAKAMLCEGGVSELLNTSMRVHPEDGAGSVKRLASDALCKLAM